MSTLLVTLGRLQMDVIARALRDVAGADCDAGGWGVAYCYGNRLETIRSAQPCAQDPDFNRLSELRTDMALVSIGGQPPTSPRELKPFLRREAGSTWTFTCPGTISHESRLETAGRITDSKDPGERYFLYLLANLASDSPVESLTAALSALAGEDSLSFGMLSAELLVVANWHGEGVGPLWAGSGELARYFCTRPLDPLPEVRWEEMPNQTVLAISRTRRELP